MNDRCKFGEEFLINIIHVLLLDYLTVTPPALVIKRSSSNLKLFTKTYDINPPVIESPSRIPLGTRQMLQTLQSMLDLEPTWFYDRLHNILNCLTTDSYVKDLIMYRYFLQSNLGWDRGLSAESVQAWKSSEESWIQASIDKFQFKNPELQAYISSVSAGFLITVIDAHGLWAKETSNSSNPYFTISYSGLTWIGPLILNTLNPTFDYTIPLLLQDEPDTKVTLTIWNRSSQNLKSDSGKKDAFLGCISFSFKDLLFLVDSGVKQHVLCKRSSKSHVSGTIGLRVSCISNQIDPIELYPKAFKTLPSDPQTKFKDLITSCYTWDFVRMSDKSSTQLSPSTTKLLKLAAEYWRIRDSFISIW